MSTVAASIPYLLRARGVLHLFLVRSWPGQLALAIPLYLHLPPGRAGVGLTPTTASLRAQTREGLGVARPAVDRYPAPPTLLLPPLPAPAATTPTPTGPAITSPTHRSAGTGPLAAAHPTPDRLRNNISHSGALRPNLSPAWGDNRLRANCPSVTHPLAPRRVRWEHVAVDQKRSAGGLGPSPGTMCLASCKSTVTRLPTELGR